ncbi:MAG TPA: hypothetical protein VFW44_17890 [Bryobacteraceae bacterium]|nr:hypothetical protein [Bryobacteraceae bacterium]
MKPAFLLVLAAFTLSAQIGQPPPGTYPPGVYPPGQYPGRNPSGPGIPGRSKRGANKDEQAPVHTEDVSGVVRKVDANSFELECEDTRFLTIQFSDTAPKPADFRAGQGLDVTATRDDDGMFHLVSMKSNKKIADEINENDELAPAPQEQEARTGPPPTILVRPDATADSDDSGPPKLKRGKPEERPSAPIPSDDNAVATRASLARPAAPPVRGNPHMALVEQAREVASNFLGGLPNYICREQVTRYVSETRTPNWNVVDIVAADLVYDDHQESYRNLQINGKPTKKAPEDSGAWSTGEFGTILNNLFDPRSATEFKYVQEDTIEHRAASVFDFKVQRVRSNWKIWVPGQYIVPQYKGSVWIDNKTAQVLRIEMQAKEIPEGFPEISVETAVDYDTISLGTADKFLLPVHSEVLSCWRNSNECQRNAIEFRNYHKFEGESTIKFESDQKQDQK